MLSRLLLAAAVTAVVATGGTAGAQGLEKARRPKFQIAVGLGTSLDRQEAIPSFFFQGGFGDGWLGLDLHLFANGATQAQVTRVAGDIAAVLRPLDPFLRDRTGYGRRVLRSFSLTAGPSWEYVAKALKRSGRWGATLTAHIDLPVGPATATKELRLRLGARRMLGTKTTVDVVRVSDSAAELFGMLAVVF